MRSLQQVEKSRTWTNAPFSLESCNARKAAHGQEVEECLGGMEDDSGFRDDHLKVKSQSAPAVQIYFNHRTK